MYYKTILYLTQQYCYYYSVIQAVVPTLNLEVIRPLHNQTNLRQYKYYNLYFINKVLYTID